MRIVLLTQSDPFYLASSIDYLLNNMPAHSAIVAGVIFDVSPFGKRESFIDKMKRTISVFGFKFFVFYSFKYLINAFDKKSSVEYVLRNKGIKIEKLDQSVNDPKSLEIINQHQPDLLISIAGNQIFKLPLINLAQKGCLNLHTALLPKYRGLMPSFWVLRNNENETGVSVFFVDEGIDSGPIIVQKRVPISASMTQRDLIILTKKVGMDAMLEAIDKVHHGDYSLIENDANKMSYFSFPKKEDVIEFYKLGKRFY